MGNFSTNQYFVVDARGESLQIYYLLDWAELPAFKELDKLDLDLNEEYTEEEKGGYLTQRVPELAEGLRFAIDGAAVPLTVTGERLQLIPGLGGMVVMNVLLRLEPQGLAWPPALPFRCEVESTLFAGATGVRECKVITDGQFDDTTRYLGEELKYQQLAQWDANGNGFYQDYDAQFLIRLEAMAEEPVISSPTAVSFAWTYTAKAAAASGEPEIRDAFSEPVTMAETPAPGTETQVAEAPVSEDGPARGVSGQQAQWARQLADIVRNREIPFPMILAGFGIAVAMGAGHALSPGHGKTVMAAYLIGERGTYLHAFVLGVVVTITHTWSILLFGTGILYAGQHVVPESVEFWSGVISGAIILVLGAGLFFQRYRAFVMATGAGGHPGGLAGVGHQHAPPAASWGPATYRNILWLGISGGIVPCPAALIVLLLAIKADRLGYGLGLIVAFSAGLAAVLVVIGIAIVRAGGAVRKRMGERHTLLLALPVFSSVLITLLGAWVIIWTLIQFNVLIVMPAA